MLIRNEFVLKIALITNTKLLLEGNYFLFNPEETRHRWFGYCIAQSIKSIKTKEFL